jgi:hypothetical protein
MYLCAGSIALSTHVIHYSHIINWETHRATFNQRKFTEDTIIDDHKIQFSVLLGTIVSAVGLNHRVVECESQGC